MTEDVYHLAIEDAAKRESGDQPIPLSCADEAQTWNSPGPQLPQYEDMPGLQPQQPLPMQEYQPHKFKPGLNWAMVTRGKRTSGAKGVQPSVTTSELDSLDKELGKDKVRDVLGDYLNYYI